MPYALCPMPYALCPMPYAQSYLIFLRKAIFNCIIVFYSEFKTTIAVLTLHEVCQILLAIGFSHKRASVPERNPIEVIGVSDYP